MALVKQGRIIDEAWLRLDETAPVPEIGQPILVPLQRWRNEHADLSQRLPALGVWLAPDQGPCASDSVWIEGLNSLPVIALDFPVFGDGRAYSTARLLRERYGYKGEIRAIGDVLLDQMFFMMRCGFDAFELKGTPDPARLTQAFERYSIAYQAALDGKIPAWRHRIGG